MLVVILVRHCWMLGIDETVAFSLLALFVCPPSTTVTVLQPTVTALHNCLGPPFLLSTGPTPSTFTSC